MRRLHVAAEQHIRCHMAPGRAARARSPPAPIHSSIMVLDPVTLLVLTPAMAAASGLYLAAEWRSVRERSLLLWSAGFAIVTVASVLALLRSSGYVLFGIWLPNGMLIAAHWLYLAGVAGFMRVRLPHTWWLLAAAWLVMLFLPDGPWWSKAMLGVQSLLIAVTTLR